MAVGILLLAPAAIYADVGRRIVGNLGVTDKHHVVSRAFVLKSAGYRTLELTVEGMVPGGASAYGKLAEVYRNGYFWNYVIINSRFVKRLNDFVNTKKPTRIRLVIPEGVLKTGVNIITFTSERPYKRDFDDYDVVDVRLIKGLPKSLTPSVTTRLPSGLRPKGPIPIKKKKRPGGFIGRWNYSVIRLRPKRVVWEGRVTVAPGSRKGLLSISFAGKKPIPARKDRPRLVLFETPSGAKVVWILHPSGRVFVGHVRYPDGQKALARGLRLK